MVGSNQKSLEYNPELIFYRNFTQTYGEVMKKVFLMMLLTGFALNVEASYYSRVYQNYDCDQAEYHRGYEEQGYYHDGGYYQDDAYGRHGHYQPGYNNQYDQNYRHDVNAGYYDQNAANKVDTTQGQNVKVDATQGQNVKVEPKK